MQTSKDTLIPRFCSRKVRYTSRERAHNALKVHPKRLRRQLVPYMCTYCGGVHIGHAQSARKRNSQQQELY
jgi:predicted RNA-binding Zn-ribbon protein involved in translation (DUF1610 family)